MTKEIINACFPSDSTRFHLLKYQGRFAVVAGLFLSAGCASPDYRQTSSMELCRKYLTLPSYNIHHPARAAELQRRGENCGTSPAGAAAAQQQADQQYLNAIQAVQPPAPLPICTTTFIGNQAVTSCR